MPKSKQIGKSPAPVGLAHGGSGCQMYFVLQSSSTMLWQRRISLKRNYKLEKCSKQYVTGRWVVIKFEPQIRYSVKYIYTASSVLGRYRTAYTKLSSGCAASTPETNRKRALYIRFVLYAGAPGFRGFCAPPHPENGVFVE